MGRSNKKSRGKRGRKSLTSRFDHKKNLWGGPIRLHEAATSPHASQHVIEQHMARHPHCPLCPHTTPPIAADLVDQMIDFAIDAAINGNPDVRCLLYDLVQSVESKELADILDGVDMVIRDLNPSIDDPIHDARLDVYLRYLQDKAEYPELDIDEPWIAYQASGDDDPDHLWWDLSAEQEQNLREQADWILNFGFFEGF